VVVSLSGYQTVMTKALAYLDSAIVISTADPSGFPLPSTWINGNALTQAQFRPAVPLLQGSVSG